jgi:hypothetical protein
MANITLGPLNTILVTAASGANRLTWPQGFNRNLDILNLGPGVLVMRTDATAPTTSDPNALQLPANFAINHLAVDGAIGLGVIAVADTTISVRVT